MPSSWRKINSETLRLAIPNILSNISIPLLSTVDTILMGHFTELHLGAVGLGSMIFNFVYWNFGFLRMGTTGFTAQAYGKKDQSEIIHTFFRAVLIVIVISLIILLLKNMIGNVSFKAMNVSEEQFELVSQYFFIRIWAAPATLSLYVFMGWFFGLQNAIIPLVLTIFINILNIVLSYYFIFYLGMEVDGVAWGTVFAQYSGLLMALVFFILKAKNLFSLVRLTEIFHATTISRFLRINIDIFLRTVILTFSFGFFYSQSSVFGSTILAVNVILLQFINWMSYGIDGFAFAAESLTGKYFGAKDDQGLQTSLKISFAWGALLALLYAGIYGILGDKILKIFTSQANLLSQASDYMIWMIIIPLFSFACYIWDGIFIGLTASKSMRNSMILSILIYLGMFYLPKDFGNHGLWFALAVFLLARGLIQTWYFYKYRFKLV
jgi:MATE family multidrug resistance protein